MARNNVAPDFAHGLRVAFDQGLITSGPMVDLGAGSGKASLFLAPHFPGYVTAYDTEEHWIEHLTAEAQRLGFSLKVKSDNVLHVELLPQSHTVICVGMTMYLPKSKLIPFLQGYWDALVVGGILHVEFATPDDHSATGDFATFPDADHTHSWWHYCGSSFCHYDMMGYLGLSLWRAEEMEALLHSFGRCTVVHNAAHQWRQKIDGTRVNRSFVCLTVQKQ